MFQIKVVEKTIIQILCTVTFFRENLAVYEIMLKNVVEPEMPQMAIWRRLHAGLVRLHACKHTPAPVHLYPHTQGLIRTHSQTHTHTEICKTNCFYTAALVSYVHCLSCWILSAVSCYSGPGLRSRNSDSLRDGGSGDRVPVGARFSASVQNGPGAHPASYNTSNGCLSWG